jgi:hypothetical protein
MANTTLTLELTGDILSSSFTSLAEGTLSSDNVTVRIPTSFSHPVTAVVTGIEFSENKSGAPIFLGGAIGSIFFARNEVSFPQVISFNGTSRSSVNVSVSATGNPCAVGIQALNCIVSLSSTALSGNITGARIPVTVSNPSITLTSTVSAINTPYAGRTCRSEFLRLRNLEYC